ncbi:MAG: lipid-A-disaccharide synthase [Pseudomonadota bacterium]
MNGRLRIGILAGESSGDILGAGLMLALRKLRPDVEFEGIGGPLMQAQGLQSRHPMERLSVMGLVEPLKRLPELLGIRKDIIEHFSQHPPAVFIGIDSPDFTLTIERRLREKGVRTVHYVSPSVWAWRQKRIAKIAKAVDLLLTLFPFEAAFYQQHNVPVCFVGHPLADVIALEPKMLNARLQLGLDPDKKTLGLLPGSRQGEVARMGPVFLATAALLAKELPDLHFLVPCANAARKQQLQAMLGPEHTTVHLLDGQSRLAMEAADAVILASGTVTLEAMLLKKPMLVCYKMAALSYAIISRMLKVPYFSLPNLLAGKPLVEELVQQQVNPPALAAKAKILLQQDSAHDALQREYMQIHLGLRQDANAKAARAVMTLL